MSKISKGSGFQEFINAPESYYLHLKLDKNTGIATLCADKRGFFTWIKAHIFSSAYNLRSIVDTLRTAENLAELSPECISGINLRIRKYNSIHKDRIAELFEKNVKKPPAKKSETAQFWETITGNIDLYSHLQRIVINSGEERIKAKAIINRYANFLNENGHTLSQFSKDHLEVEIVKQLVSKSAKEKTYSLSSAFDLCTFSTCNDGSCGLHALLCDDAKYGISTEHTNARLCKAEEARNDFCTWLRGLGAVENWPAAMRMQLTNYLVHFGHERELAPDFIKLHEALIEPYYARYISSLKEVQEGIKSEFLHDPAIVAGYIECLQNKNVFLTQPELLEMAKYFSKPIALYQPGWGYEISVVRVKLYDRTGRAVDLAIENDNEKQIHLNYMVLQGDFIPVFYNGIDHFERAFMVHKKTISISSPAK